VNIIWTEKYRPKEFSEIKGQEKIISRIRAFIEKGNMPHLLFAGPTGVGKTTLSLIIARSLFGENWSNNFLELNASDERGIDVIRHKVKDFARTKAINNSPFKVIYLDECDSLTREAQQALRRTMEKYSKTCRFILSCNYSSKILDPIQSRCTVFRFRPLEKENIKEIILNISSKEGLNIDEDGINAIFSLSNGDARRAENILQSCAAISNDITYSSVYDIVSSAEPVEIKDILKMSISGNFIGSRDLLLNTMAKHGLSGTDIIKQIQKEILELDTDDLKKMSMIEKCGEIEFRLIEGSDEFIQLESLLANFSK
jgi:replication factor C small subunit